MQHTIAFNTGRPYSAKGQRIAAIVRPSGQVAFLDLDRNICGTTRDSIHDPLFADSPLRPFVMLQYDLCAYTEGLDDALRTVLTHAAQGVASR